MKVFEEELWASSGLKVRCGSTGPPGEGEKDCCRTVWEVEDLAGSNVDASVLYYDKDKFGNRAKKVSLHFRGESEMQTFTDALEFSTGKLRELVYGENGTVEARLRRGMQDVLEALSDYCNVFSDLPDGEMPGGEEPLGVDELELIKHQFMKSNLAALVKEEEWREKNLELDTVAFLSRVHEIVPKLLQTIYQQSALIRGLKKIPLDDITEENKVLRGWFEELNNGIPVPIDSRKSVEEAPRGGAEALSEEEKEKLREELLRKHAPGLFGDVSEPVKGETKPEPEEDVETVRDGILRVLPDHSYPFNGKASNEVADEIERPRSSVSPEMTKLVREGKVVIWSSCREREKENGEIEEYVVPRTYMKAPEGLAEDRVLDFMKYCRLQLQAENVATAVGIRPGTAYSRLLDLWRKGLLQRTVLPGQRAHLYWALES